MQILTRNILLPSLFVAIVLVIAMPRTPKFSQDYRKGSPWKHETLVAQFDFPILRTDDQLLAAESADQGPSVPYYRYIDNTFATATAALSRLDVPSSVRRILNGTLESIYERGVVDRSFDSATTAYVQKNKRAARYPVSELYTVQTAREKFLSSSVLTIHKADSLFSALDLFSLISPNLIFDAQTTELVASEKLSVSSAVDYVKAGQLIVSNGEIVTAEIAQVLDSYKNEYDSSMGDTRPAVLVWLGNFMVALVLVLILLMVIQFTSLSVFKSSSRFLYAIFVYLIGALGAIASSRFAPEYIYLMPFTITALFLQAFFPNKLIISVYFASLIPLLIFSQNGFVLFVMFLAAGLVAIYMFRFFGRGWRQFVTAGVTFLLLSFVYIGFYLVDLVSDSLWRVIPSLFFGSILTVACYPFIYLFEKMFNLVSSSRLEELSDTNNSLLRELASKAPGTFQHSLQVMNLATAVARETGASEQLLRAGAMYHDIGKINNPLCFVENESMLAGESDAQYHSVISPLQSAQDIIRHVQDGEDLARKHHLPNQIIDFIRTHHGTSSTSYFLNSYLNGGGDPAAESEFHYAGPNPSTKEQIILMLCDSVEAASRTLKDYSSRSFDDLVENIVNSKMSQGQFANADISIMELGIVKATLKTNLGQMYHERIAYPTRNKQ